MTSIWPLVWMAPCLKNKMLLYSTLVLIYKHQPCVPSSITGEAMYLLNHWGSPVPPQSLWKPCTPSITRETLHPLQSLGKPCISSITGESLYLLNHWGSPVSPQSLGNPCTSSITGEALYLLNHWGIPVPPQSLRKPCTSLITGESLYLLNHWGNIAPSSVTGEAMYLLNHCGFIFQWQFQNNSK